MSENYGIATDAIATFNKMGQDFDITTESMMRGLSHLNVMMGAAALGRGGRGGGMRGLGIMLQHYGLSVKDATGHMKTMQGFLGDVADRMTTMSGMEQNLLVRRLGLDPSMVRMLRNGREEFEKMYQTASEGLPFTAEDYKKADEFELAFRRARSTVTILTQQIALKLMPMFQRAMDRFLKWWKTNGEAVMKRVQYWVTYFSDWAENVFGFIGRLTGKTSTLESAMKLLGVAVGALIAMKMASWAMTAVQAFMTLLSPMGLIAAAIGLVIGVILLLIDDYEAWQRGEGSVIGTIMKHWDDLKAKSGSVVDKIVKVLKVLKGMWELAKQSWKDAIKDLQGTFGGAWPKIKQELEDFAYLVGAAIVILIALGIAAVYAAGKLVDVFAKLEKKKLRWDQDPSLFWKDFLDVSSKSGDNAFKNFFEAFKKEIDKDPFVQSFAKQLDFVGKLFTEKIPQLGETIKQTFLDAGQKIEDIFLSAVRAMIDKAIEIISGLPAKMGEKATGWMPDWIKEHLPKFGGGPAPTAATGAQPPQTPQGAVQTLMSANVPPAQAYQKGGIDQSQLNSNNVESHTTINVNSVGEAVDAKARLDQQDRQRQQNQLSFAVQSNAH
jgi:hypothetical protein